MKYSWYDIRKWVLTYSTSEFMTGGKFDASKTIKYVFFHQGILFLKLFPQKTIGDILIFE